MLWAIHLIANKADLSEEQLSYLKKSFRVKFLSSEQPGNREQQELFESFIDLRLPGMGVSLPKDAEEFYARRTEAAKVLCELREVDDESWLRQSEEIIRATFAPAAVGGTKLRGELDGDHPAASGRQSRADGLKANIVLTLRPVFERFGRHSRVEIEGDLGGWVERNFSTLDVMDGEERGQLLEQLLQASEVTPAQRSENRPGEKKKPWSWVFERFDQTVKAFQNRPQLPYKDE